MMMLLMFVWMVIHFVFVVVVDGMVDRLCRDRRGECPPDVSQSVHPKFHHPHPHQHPPILPSFDDTVMPRFLQIFFSPTVVHDVDSLHHHRYWWWYHSDHLLPIVMIVVSESIWSDPFCTTITVK